MDKTSQKVAKILLSIKAVSLSPKKPFKYSSGILSPVYTDCRILMAYPKERKIIRDLYIKEIAKLGSIDLIAATATAGIPHAAWIADKLNLPMVYVRGSAKDHGKGNQIEGIVKKGQKAVVVEDLISTGESAATTANATRGAGAKISHIIAIITYGMKKSQNNFTANKLKLITLTTFQDVVEVAQKMGYINKEEMPIILEWTKDPPTWGKNQGFE
ncbi:MAG: orotate phosphoribosyltransferase [Candidatus Daviesbacteria bacterium]|nr:orotate phosphoribosyltransferase [Candidatus Daviesbacteria bacterium]